MDRETSGRLQTETDRLAHKKKMDSAIQSKFEVIRSAVAEELPEDASNEDVIFALQSSIEALYGAVECNIRALALSTLLNPKREDTLLKIAKILHDGTVQAIKEGIEAQFAGEKS